jgi:hypothetical protein
VCEQTAKRESNTATQVDAMNNKLLMWLIGAGGVLVAVLLFGGIALALTSQVTYPTDNASLRALHGDQCEQPKDNGVIVERQNTWSNLAYLLAGIFVLVRARTAVGRFYGGNLVLLSFMSGLYHATLGHGMPQALDVAWVYAVLFSLILKLSSAFTQTSDLGRLSWWQWAIAGAIQLVLFFVATFAFEKTQVLAFLILSLLVVPLIQGALFLIVRTTGRPTPWYWWGVMTLLLTFFGFLIKKATGWDSDAVFPILVGNIFVLFLLVTFDALKRDDVKGMFPWPLVWEIGLIVVVTGLGFTFRLTDGYREDTTQKILCSPGGLFQAHAWWHILSALALLLVYDVVTQLERRDSPWVADRPALFPER